MPFAVIHPSARKSLPTNFAVEDVFEEAWADVDLRGTPSWCDALVEEADYVCRTLAIPASGGREDEFERAYSASGEWARLFQHGEGYLGTELLQRYDDPREYLALDRWASCTAYETFRARFRSEYRQLDRRLEELTEEEVPLGAFETLS